MHIFTTAVHCVQPVHKSGLLSVLRAQHPCSPSLAQLARSIWTVRSASACISTPPAPPVYPSHRPASSMCPSSPRASRLVLIMNSFSTSARSRPTSLSSTRSHPAGAAHQSIGCQEGGSEHGAAKAQRAGARDERSESRRMRPTARPFWPTEGAFGRALLPVHQTGSGGSTSPRFHHHPPRGWPMHVSTSNAGCLCRPRGGEHGRSLAAHAVRGKRQCWPVRRMPRDQDSALFRRLATSVSGLSACRKCHVCKCVVCFARPGCGLWYAEYGCIVPQSFICRDTLKTSGVGGSV